MNINNQKKKQEELEQSAPSPVTGGGGYVESDSVRLAKEQLNSLKKPGAFQNPWQKGLDDIIGKIQNREKFTYDLNGDALYQQYKDQYITQGQQAMMDTMGQAAALTGGYGNSYAQTVGQQTYQGHLQGLNDKVPELYQLALDQYNREGDELYNQYGLLADRENTEYGRYRDTVSDYNTERGYLTDQYNNERNFDYGQQIDARDYAYQIARDTVADKQWQSQFDEGVRQFDTTFDYQKDRDAVADSQWQTQFDESVRQFDTSTQIQQQQWQAEFNETVRQYDNDYVLKVRQIEEDIRHNKISEAQGQQQIDLAKQELEQRRSEAAQDYEYKMATLKVKEGDKDDTPDNPPKATVSEAEDFLNNLVRTLEKTSASDQRNARSTILSEINKAQKAGAITAEEAAELKKKFAPTGSSGGRYTY